MAELPMFPLGSVLFPTSVLPLHIFEPRYRVLVHDVLAAAGEFGVCLIERGHEVGGGDVRTTVGTVARVREAGELPDGRWAIVAVGTRRISVETWLPDDPYPRADVSDFPDPEPDEAQLALLPDVAGLLREALAKTAELGERAAPATAELSDDPVLASHQMAAMAPIPTFDRQQLLAAPTVGLRLASLRDLLREAIEVLDLRVAGEGPAADGP